MKLTEENMMFWVLAKSKLDDLRFVFEENERWDLAEALEKYIEDIQSVIDAITDDELFVSKPVEEIGE